MEIQTLIIDAILWAHILRNDARESKSRAINIPESFQGFPPNLKKKQKNQHLGHAVAHEGVQVDPKTAQGTPMAAQVHCQTAPTFVFNTELLRSFSKNPPRKPHRPSEDLAHATSEGAEV